MHTTTEWNAISGKSHTYNHHRQLIFTDTELKYLTKTDFFSIEKMNFCYQKIELKKIVKIVKMVKE